MEAKPQATSIQNALNVMYSSLMTARRVDTVNLSLQVAQSKADLEMAEQELMEKRAEIAELKSKLGIQSSST